MTYLRHNLQLLVRTNVLALAHSSLELLYDLVVQWRSRGDGHLDLAPRGADQLLKLLADTLQNAQAVVLGKGLEEVANGVGLVGDVGGLLDLGHNLALVLGGEGRGAQDGLKAGILLEGLGEALDGLGDAVEGLRLDGGGVLPMAVLVAVFDCALSLEGNCRRTRAEA